MESIINDGICRCCATEGSFKDLDTTYHWMGCEEVYADMIKDCFNISLSKPETYNNGGICEVCITQLRNASNFKRQVQLTEKQFMKKVEESSFRANIVKIEVPRIEDDNDDIFDGNVSDGFSSPEYDVPLTKIKIEKDSEKPKKRTAKASTSKAKKLKREDGEPSTKRTVSAKSEGGGKVGTPMDKIEKQMQQKGLVGVKEIWKHQNNIKEILECSNATPIRSSGVIGYICCYCCEQFLDPADLKQHTIENHEGIDNASFKIKSDLAGYHVKLDITGLQCAICDTGVDTVDDLVMHLIEIHQRNIFTDVTNRIIPFKFDTDVLECYVCHNNFTNFKILLVHMGQHIRNFVCDICNVGFVYPKQLLLHSKGHQTGSYKCDRCPKVFNTIEKRKSHVKSVHIKKQRLNRCGYCGEVFAVYQQKIKHLISVHGVAISFKCTACDRTFWHQKALRVHKERDHLLERRHSCTECDKKFYSTSLLKDHMLKHNGLKRYQCDICLKSYGRRSTLTEHLRIHADDRRYKCDHCGQGFVQKCSWRGHMKNKHGEDV